MTILNPTLAGAVSKAERGIALLRIPQAAAEHLRGAMDAFKSAYKLAASHHTVLVELEGELPDPGPALFDSAGAPVPGAAVTVPITSDEAILGMTGEDYGRLAPTDQANAESDLMFAARVHFRARGFLVERWHRFEDEIENHIGFDAETWDWIIQQIREAGEFDWPTRCSGGCGKALSPEPDGTAPECWQCRSARRERERKAAAKAAKPKPAKKAEKPAPKTIRNPLETDGGDE